MVKGSWRAAKTPKRRWVVAGSLSQFGTTWFRDEPRWESEWGVSVVRGVRDARTLYRLMTGKPVPPPDATTRFFSAQQLRSEPYMVLCAPSIKNPYHSLICAGIHEYHETDASRSWWRQPARRRLDVYAHEEVDHVFGEEEEIIET